MVFAIKLDSWFSKLQACARLFLSLFISATQTVIMSGPPPPASFCFHTPLGPGPPTAHLSLIALRLQLTSRPAMMLMAQTLSKPQTPRLKGPGRGTASPLIFSTSAQSAQGHESVKPLFSRQAILFWRLINQLPLEMTFFLPLAPAPQTGCWRGWCCFQQRVGQEGVGKLMPSSEAHIQLRCIVSGKKRWRGKQGSREKLWRKKWLYINYRLMYRNGYW